MPPTSRARARCSIPMPRSAAAPIPNGDYRCRAIKLGAKIAGHARLCRLSRRSAAASSRSATLQRFAKLTGSQRPVGLIFPDDALRQVFLGTLVLGDEARAYAI